jgi:DegV family protein with EDD domain
MAVRIVTDSTSDIEPERAKRHAITVVPLLVQFGNRSYRDVVELSRAEFYSKLLTESVLPTTSQPTVTMFQEVFAASAPDPAICVTISSHLSGTFNSARIAAERVSDRQRVVVYDSQSATGSLGLMVLRAAEAAAAGATLEAILKLLDEERRTQRLFACVPDLSHLQRSGRIGRARAALGTMMRIVPVLSLERGEVVAKAQVRTLSRARELMLDLALADLPSPTTSRFIVMHTNAPELASATAARLRERLGSEPKFLEIWEAGPVIATHGGPGAVGVCVA